MHGGGEGRVRGPELLASSATLGNERRPVDGGTGKVTRKTWMGIAAGCASLSLGVLALTALPHVVPRPAAARAFPPTVTLHPPTQRPACEPPPPAPPPQTHLLQPVPGVPAPEPPRPVTVARLPLIAPLHTEPAGEPALPPQAPSASAGTDVTPPGAACAAGGWSQPIPLEQTLPTANPPETTHTVRTGQPVTIRPLPPLATVPLAALPETTRKPQPLTGTHPCTLTDQHGLTLPKQLRQQIGDRPLRALYVAPGPEQSLWLYSAAGLERLSERLERSPAGDSRVRQARRLCFAQAEKCGVDRTGHTNLPDHLVQYAGLQQEVVLLGVGDHLELWDARHWQEYLQRRSADPLSPEQR
jgi:MraZ protein